MPGDYILVNKQIPGPRIYPRFPQARINGKLVTKRYKGFRKIKRNDILVFNPDILGNRDAQRSFFQRKAEDIPNDLESYVFQKNYYFMAGEYVYDSRDSRYWGLLPEECIVGKAILIWKSQDIHTGKIR
jgi:signal peptidase I